MKNKEIERKFLIDNGNLPDLSKMDYRDIIQGYVENIEGSHLLRLRQILHCSKNGIPLGDEYCQTIKGRGLKIRDEYEIKLLKNQFSVLWPLCENKSVHKYRYELPTKSSSTKRIYLDVYKNELEGLYTAEVEFDNENDCDNYEPESWFGKEVTEDFRYTNVRLAINGLPISDSLDEEKEKLKAMEGRIELFKELTNPENDSPLVSYTWALEKILGFSKDEIKQIMEFKEKEKKERDSVFEGEVNNFYLIAEIQEFVYKAKKRWDSKYKAIPLTGVKIEEFSKSIKHWSNYITQKERFEAFAIYDETLWPPLDVIYGSRVFLDIRRKGHNESYQILIDLNKNFESCCSIDKEPINIFSPKFINLDDKNRN